jgi:hypothetical protein
MSYDDYDNNNLHRGKAHRFVRILPVGFMLDGVLQHELRGEVVRIRFVRKCFGARCLACHSNDGLQSRLGFDCRACQEMGCRPFVRLQIADAEKLYTLDLTAASARRLLLLAAEARDGGTLIIGRELRLTVLSSVFAAAVDFQYA